MSKRFTIKLTERFPSNKIANHCILLKTCKFDMNSVITADISLVSVFLSVQQQQLIIRFRKSD